MSKLPFELFLALRYLRPKRTSVSIITLISILGVMLGVAVLIIVIAVMSGFDREWRNKILGFNAHVEIGKPDKEAPLIEWRGILPLATNIPGVKAGGPQAGSLNVLAVSEEEGGRRREAVPILKGVDPILEPGISLIPSNMIQGAFDLSGRGAVLGKELAQTLRLDIGDRFSAYSPANIRRMEQSMKNKGDEAVLPAELELRGIFDVGFSDFNSFFIITSLETAQDFFEMGDAVSRLDLVLLDPMAAPDVQQRLAGILGPEIRVTTWIESFSYLFDTLVMEKNMIFFLLFFIVLVAAFGITSSLITFVVQKTREVGVLKSLGASRMGIVWIFLSQGIIVGVIGVATGTALGLLALGYRNEFLEFMNRVTGRSLLNSSIYKLYELPAEIKSSDILVITLGSLLICTLAGAIPAFLAGRLKPVEALRHE
ncbi:MAG: FtsX-like permease family protein [Verrucomicrobia bacterium]|nr:FtsX-like permease family protein [Verrucomicrobiota bacterium]